MSPGICCCWDEALAQTFRVCMQNKMKFWCLLQHCLFFQHQSPTQQLKVNIEVFSLLYVHSRVHVPRCGGQLKTQRDMLKLQVNQKIWSFFQVFLDFVSTKFHANPCTLLKWQIRKWALKIAQLLPETRPISLLGIIQIHARPLEHCMWKDSLQIFNIYQK